MSEKLPSQPEKPSRQEKLAQMKALRKSLEDKDALDLLEVLDTKSPQKYKIMAVQQLLTSLGFNTNGIDGIIGPDTKSAIESFKNAYQVQFADYESEIEPGKIDDNLIAALSTYVNNKKLEEYADPNSAANSGINDGITIEGKVTTIDEPEKTGAETEIQNGNPKMELTLEKEETKKQTGKSREEREKEAALARQSALKSGKSVTISGEELEEEA